ncbi:hypothetical protein DYE50_03815 [Treponema ruminis]|uniref:HNH endonuclease n=1 Tax=Treponema ruminis TaxID=744515 RepID=A0A7W8LLJ9_9SPIR|nr:hypothetical protein [Treponema ruminis]MBB5225423.1 hypothetical protein [Treponema ruminis]QSI01707.1 hypothetical protein DYE50_03815 [Treponema ruminis]
MAGTVKRTNLGDAANIFVRCMLSDISDLLGGFSKEELKRTLEYFDYKCPYTGEDISVEYENGKWVLDHLIPHNRESVGLNLYGNIIVTTRTTNSAKAAKSFEDFIRFETKGTDEEKEKRIQKIRNFQKESGYFNKVKNIDEIKELCKNEYDFIQNRLREHNADYESILGIKREVFENHSKRVFIANPIKKDISKSMTTKNSIVKISKNQAIQILRSGGVPVSGQITFSSENSGVYKYWANPSVNYIYNDWWLILNDIDNRTLYAFFIPANSIQEEKILVRTDKPELIDIQINYDDDLFMDSRSKICFKKWLKKDLKY